MAAEVRNLAQRSAVAAKEIGTLIQTSADAVKDGVQQVNDTGGAMLRIAEGVKGVSTYLGEITSAANAQRNGLGQINSAVANLDQMTQQNAALVEEAAAAAASPRDQAQRLSEVVSIFDLGIDPTLPLKRPLTLGV